MGSSGRKLLVVSRSDRMKSRNRVMQEVKLSMKLLALSLKLLALYAKGSLGLPNMLLKRSSPLIVEEVWKNSHNRDMAITLWYEYEKSCCCISWYQCRLCNAVFIKSTGICNLVHHLMYGYKPMPLVWNFKKLEQRCYEHPKAQYSKIHQYKAYKSRNR